MGIRHIVNDKVETLLLPDPRSAEGGPGIPKIVGFSDIDNDKSLEIVAYTGEPLTGMGTQWIGHWVIAGVPQKKSSSFSVSAQAGCDTEGHHD